MHHVLQWYIYMCLCLFISWMTIIQNIFTITDEWQPGSIRFFWAFLGKLDAIVLISVRLKNIQKWLCHSSSVLWLFGEVGWCNNTKHYSGSKSSPTFFHSWIVVVVLVCCAFPVSNYIIVHFSFLIFCVVEHPVVVLLLSWGQWFPLWCPSINIIDYSIFLFSIFFAHISHINIDFSKLLLWPFALIQDCAIFSWCDLYMSRRRPEFPPADHLSYSRLMTTALEESCPDPCMVNTRQSFLRREGFATGKDTSASRSDLLN